MKTKLLHRSILFAANHGTRHWLLLLCCMLQFPLMAQRTEEVHTPNYYIGRIKNLVEHNAWQEAKREINAGLELYPCDPDLRYYNGRYYYVLGNINEARYNLVRATQEDDQHFSSRRLLVDVEDTLHHYSSAICYINELLEFQPYDRDLWRRKIGLYRKMNNHVEADAALERLAHIYPNDSIVRRELMQRRRENWNQTLRKSSQAEKAENLEQWLDLDPHIKDYYVELVGAYEGMGEYERALGAVNRGLVQFPHDAELVKKGIGIMTSMGLYTQAHAFAKQHGVSSHVYQGLLHEMADEARLRDPYEVNGRLYALTHNRDALTYLINTSLTRGYEDDARYYLAEAMKNEGRTPRLLMSLYTLERRAGNEKAMITLLQELAELQPGDDEITTTYAELMMNLAAREMQTEQWDDAHIHLDRALYFLKPQDEAWGAAVARQITVMGHQGRFSEALEFYHEYTSLTDSVELRTRFASAYEDLAANHLRGLVEEEHYSQALREAQALLSIVPNSEPALRCCINMSQTLKRSQLFQAYAKQGYETYPDNPYFINKYAIALQQQGREIEALQLLNPRRSNDEWVNPQLVAAFSGITHEWATILMQRHMNDLALEVLDSALVHDPQNRELLYDKGVAYEQLKDWVNAYRYQSRYYEPSNAEQQAYYEHMHWLGFRSFRNRIDASYTHALYDTRSGELASIGHLYSIASVAYSRLWRHDTFTGQISYKGIDGSHYIETDEKGNIIEEREPGGVGLEFMGQWEHTFDSRWSGMTNLAFSTRYFNKFGFNVSASYAANHGWTPTLRLGYRRTPETYLFLGSDAPSTVERNRFNLFLLTPSVEKAWERIKVTGSLDLILMNSSLYYNVGLKGKLFVNDDNITSVALVTGFGSFPELSFFDQTALRGLSHTNAMVGFDAQYLLTRHLYIGLAGSWNTSYNPYRLSDGTLTDSYRNIFSLTVQLHVAF